MPDMIPFLRPGETCNARLNRGDGTVYCEMPAGADTTHPGQGRCRIHGGHDGSKDIDFPDELFRKAGLDPIIELAENMRASDQEYLMEVGNNALVVTRSGVLARLADPTLTPRELNDLTNALTRIDNMISKHPLVDKPAEAEEAKTTQDELERLRALRAAQ